jgi:hypothetical protein
MNEYGQRHHIIGRVGKSTWCRNVEVTLCKSPRTLKAQECRLKSFITLDFLVFKKILGEVGLNPQLNMRVFP